MAIQHVNEASILIMVKPGKKLDKVYYVCVMISHFALIIVLFSKI